ncbi:MAG TPA: PQQ-binding-like beta-propeller repeat protein [Terriglobales bacterium]|nr:PQQ-binding-like beta-propeller repeat protein [Terriglobales bacterium]
MTPPRKVSAVSRHTSLCGSILLLFASLSFGQAAIQLSKPVGPPTTRTLVSGEDFPADAEVNLYFDRARVGQVTTDSTGSFSDAPIEVPKGALPGKHYVIAKAQTEAKARFLVRTNWPQYGFGPNGGRHNRFENVLNPQNVDKLTLRFSYTAPAGVGPPVVAEGMVYFGSNDGNVYAVNADTGALVWKAEGSGPAVADGIIYFMGSYDTFLYARNAKTGALVWAYNIQIFAFAPVVSDGVVYVTAATAAGYDLFALDARTGFLYWRDFIWVTPDLSAAAIARGTVYVGASGSSGSDLLAVSNGSVLWQYPITVSSSPAVVNGVVYAGSADDNVYALDSTTGSLRWKYSTTKSVYSSPATADGAIYVGSEDGNIYALNASTGALVWKRSIGYFAASPAVANGVVYVVSSNGNVYHLNALNAKTGVLLRKYVFKPEQPTDPVVANGIVYFGSGDGHLYAFGLP